MRSHTKFGHDRFSRVDVSWIQTDKQTKNKKTDRQAKYIYIDGPRSRIKFLAILSDLR